jgi:hypothetical protein
MQSPASSSGSELASACFIAVSRRCSDGEKIDGRDMEVRWEPAGKVQLDRDQLYRTRQVLDRESFLISTSIRSFSR